MSSSGQHVARRGRSDKSPDIVDTSWQASIYNRRPTANGWCCATRVTAQGRGCVKTHAHFVFGGLLTPPDVEIVEYRAI